MSKHKILVALKDLYPHCRHFMSRTPEQANSFLKSYLIILEKHFGNLDTRHEVGTKGR